MDTFTPSARYVTEMLVSKSKFIAILEPLNSLEEYTAVIEKIKAEFPKAKHYCYAMRYEGYAKYSDDKEPHGTAGRPILLSLERKSIDKAIIVVVRYFGGKKLGAGNLLRTYVKSSTSVVDKFINEK